MSNSKWPPYQRMDTPFLALPVDAAGGLMEPAGTSREEKIEMGTAEELC